jgi:hypothetical protein
MTIKLENFTATIDVDTIEVTSVNDNLASKTASVSIVINSKYGTTLSGFTYSTTWEDTDVIEWANNELIKYEI